MKRSTVFVLCLLGMRLAFGQVTPPYSILYDDTQVNRIYITMAADSLEEMYEELENEHEYAVQFIFDGVTQQDTLQEVGFRLRGNTSLYSAKKSFKISFNTYNAGRTFEGAKKLNLIGNHNDPTMLREKIYFDIYNSLGLPIRRVGFAEVYINGSYYGFYTVVEEYDDIWLRDRYGDDSGALFKCIWGSTLTYNGTNPNAYPTYEQQTHEQQERKDELVMLTDIINNTPIADLPCALEPIFDVDQFLKIYALDISTGHWDNYGANQNNYYLYHDAISGQFKFLSYDCDNVLGVDWFGIDWTDRNVYNWNFDGRPLVERCLEVDAYYERFSYYLEQIAAHHLDPAYWFPKIDAMRDLIAPSALLDDFRTYDYGFSYADFLDGFDTDDVIGHCPYGIKNFISLRNASTIDQVSSFDMAPIIHYPAHTPLLPQAGLALTVNSFVEENSSLDEVVLYYGFNGIPDASLTLYDDGLHGDLLSDDHWYGNSIPVDASATTVHYYIKATDISGNVSRYPVCDSIVHTVGYIPPTLVINEILADNQATIPDDDGEFPDYIELYNYGEYSIFLGNLSITDDPDRPTKWFLPDMLLPADTYALLYADNETEQGLNHASFSLDAENDMVRIHAPVTSGYAIIDSVSFTQLPPDTSWGRIPNGTGPFVLLTTPSPGAYNGQDAPESPSGFQVMLTNNPGSGSSNLIITLAESTDVRLTVYTVDGKAVYTEPTATLPAGTYSFPLEVTRMASGTYYIHIVHNDQRLVVPYVVM